jgi:DNA polymerase V
LQGKPVIVLSNNDGCVVARSNEAKALGIGMGVAAFEIAGLLKKHNVIAMSSNYTLYADMSSRVMEVLSTFTPQMEVYSIDEAFLNLAGVNCALADYARQMRQTVKKWTGMPVSIGIGNTKTLAKIANHISKRSPQLDGVLDLTASTNPEQVLAQVSVEKVWGIGIRSTIKLKRAGIETALDLSKADISWIRGRFGVVGVRTVYELRGTCCYQLEHNLPALSGVEGPAQKSIIVSRMFGEPIEDIDRLKEAISTYAARAGERLREQKLTAGAMSVFVTTSRFIKNSYFNSHTIEFPISTSDTTELIRTAVSCIDKLYRGGRQFKKCGVILLGLVPENRMQRGLFDNGERERSDRLMRAIDAINAKVDTPVRWAIEGINQPWQVKFKRRSKRYTTRWDELPVVI